MEEDGTNSELDKGRKRTPTRERVRKYRATHAGPQHIARQPPKSGKERVQKYWLKKQQEAASTNGLATPAEIPCPKSRKSHPSAMRTQRYRTRLRQYYQYVKPLPLTQKDCECRSYAKKKQQQLEQQIMEGENLNTQQANQLTWILIDTDLEKANLMGIGK